MVAPGNVVLHDRRKNAFHDLAGGLDIEGVGGNDRKADTYAGNEEKGDAVNTIWTGEEVISWSASNNNVRIDKSKFAEAEIGLKLRMNFTNLQKSAQGQLNDGNWQKIDNVSPLSGTYFEFDITKEILAKLPSIQLQLIDGSIYPDSGRVATISGVIDPTTGSVSMRALFPNSHNILRSNSTGNVIFPNPMQSVIMIPQSATTEIQDKRFVYVVQADNTVKNTEVKTFTLDDGKNFFVTAGLKQGDKIVIEGVQALSDGQAITPITPAEKEAAYQKALQDQRDGNIQTAFQ